MADESASAPSAPGGESAVARAWDDAISRVQGMAMSARQEGDVVTPFADSLRILAAADTVVVCLDPVRSDDPAGGSDLAYGPPTGYLVARAGRRMERFAGNVDTAGRLAVLAASGIPICGTGALAQSGPLGHLAGPWMIVPFGSESGRLGWVCVVRPAGKDGFTDDDVDHVITFCARTAFALRYLRLRAAAQAQLVVRERERIARDLHDLTIQRIFGVGMMLDTGLRLTNGECVPADRAAAAIEEINEAIAELRRAIDGLDIEPPPATAAEVMQAVRRECGRQALRFPESPALRLDLPDDLLLDNCALRALTAAIREGLSNAARHSFCRSVTLDLGAHEGQLSLRLANEGQARAAPDHEGRGLRNLRARAADLGGDCSMDVSNTGSLLRWWIPIGPTARKMPGPDPASG